MRSSSVITDPQIRVGEYPYYRIGLELLGFFLKIYLRRYGHSKIVFIVIGLDWNNLTKLICISCSNIAIVPVRCVPPGGVIMLFVVNPTLWTQLPVLL